MVVNNQLFTFNKALSGGKIKPFLNKKFIRIPKNVEETYFKKFVAPLVASFDVYAKGFDILTESYDPKPVLTFPKFNNLYQTLLRFLIKRLTKKRVMVSKS